MTWPGLQESGYGPSLRIEASDVSLYRMERILCAWRIWRVDVDNREESAILYFPLSAEYSQTVRSLMRAILNKRGTVEVWCQISASAAMKLAIVSDY